MPPVNVMMKSTGKLGEVMKESTELALTNARKYLSLLRPESTFFRDNEIYMHAPEGGTPKEGPSAGCAMTVALLSLALDVPVRADFAMTGEISLTGKVLPVGGIREKVIASRRSGVKVIVLPKENENDFDELQDYLKEDISVHYADTFVDVIKVAFDDCLEEVLGDAAKHSSVNVGTTDTRRAVASNAYLA